MKLTTLALTLLVLSTCLGLPARAQNAPDAGVRDVQALPSCAQTVRDGLTGDCLSASSVPALGRLYPLSMDFFVDAASGYTGLGTLTPFAKLHVISPPSSSTNRTLILENQATAGVALEASALDTTASSFPVAVSSRVEAEGGTGVAGRHRTFEYVSQSGVSGSTGGFPLGTSVGVSGFAFSSTTADMGVLGVTYSSTDGRGVAGIHVSTTGTGAGAYGRTESVDANANGVVGEVRATAPGPFSAGVRGINEGTAGNGIGVYGSHAGSGFGVYGLVVGPGIGVLGAAPAGGFAVYAAGDSATSGTKSFVQPHPFDPSKEIRFVCLEGNESGTYFRGTSALENGRAVIEVPEDFRLVSEATSLTVQVTPYGPGNVWVQSRDLQRIVVCGEADVAFDYFVNGVRRGFADFDTLHPNRSFVPEFLDEPYGDFLPAAARQILIENGTLKPDYTPDEATANRLGWTLRSRPEPRPEAASVLDLVRRPASSTIPRDSR